MLVKQNQFSFKFRYQINNSAAYADIAYIIRIALQSLYHSLCMILCYNNVS